MYFHRKKNEMFSLMFSLWFVISMSNLTDLKEFSVADHTFFSPPQKISFKKYQVAKSFNIADLQLLSKWHISSFSLFFSM